MNDHDDMMRHVNRPDPDLRTQAGRDAIREAFPTFATTHWEGLNHPQRPRQRTVDVMQRAEEMKDD